MAEFLDSDSSSDKGDKQVQPQKNESVNLIVDSGPHQNGDDSDDSSDSLDQVEKDLMRIEQEEKKKMELAMQ